VYETYPYQKKNGQIRNQKTSGNSCFELLNLGIVLHLVFGKPKTELLRTSSHLKAAKR
jgi:hypothetical protein